MTPIKHISDIDTNTHHGRMLVAAIIKISSESLIPKPYEQVIGEIAELSANMYSEPIIAEKAY